YVWVSGEYADWLGLPPDQIAGRLIVDVIGPDAFATIQPHVERVLQGESLDYESIVDFTTIGRRWVHARYVPVSDASGAVEGWVATIQDITSRKQLENADARLAAIVEGSDDA